MTQRQLNLPLSATVDPDKPYPMHLPRLGHAMIVNNVEKEYPGTAADVEALRTAYERVGFEVRVHTNCGQQDMIRIKRRIMKSKTHKDCNCFLLTIITHGNDKGHLMDAEKRKAWDIELFVAELSAVKTLEGKPKILVMQCCREEKWKETDSATLGSDDDKQTANFLPDKADMLLAYSTVPDYRAYAGDEDGSVYLQSFSKYLQQEYKRRPLNKILQLVKQRMSKQPEGPMKTRQISEERNGLLYDVEFSEFYKNKESDERGSSDEDDDFEDALNKPANDEIAATENETEHKTQTIDTKDVVDSKNDTEEKKEKNDTKSNIIRTQISVEIPEVTVFAEILEKENDLQQDKVEKLSDQAKKGKQDLTEHTGSDSLEKTKMTEQITDPKEKENDSRNEDEGQHKADTNITCTTTMHEYSAALRETFTFEKHDQEEQMNALELRLLSTHNTNLQEVYGFTVMPSTGDIVLYGNQPPAIRVCKIIDKKLTLRTLKYLCEHNDLQLLPGKNAVAISCAAGNNIKLMNLQSEKVTTAFKCGKLSLLTPTRWPHRMCLRENGKMYVYSWQEPYPIMELDCSNSQKFTGPTKELESGFTGYCKGLCYLPAPLLAVVLSGDNNKIRAISVSSNELIWEVNGEIEGLVCEPHGLLYHPEHKVILVCDGSNERILVLKPDDGSCLQAIPLPDVGIVHDLCVYEDQIILLHNKNLISYFSLVY